MYLEKLTIIIPTFQREDYIKRCMLYWSGKSVNVIIIDGSKCSVNKNFINSLQNNITYLYNPVSYFKRILSIIKNIKTKYVMLGCDDEFYVPSTLKSCIQELELDKKLVTCGGMQIGFEWNGQSLLGFNNKKLSRNNLNIGNTSLRLRKHFSDYLPLHYYSVSRSKYWKLAAEVTFKREFSFFAAGEIQMEMLLLFSGKTRTINEILWLRSQECSPIRNNSPSMHTQYSISEWWNDPQKKNEKKNLLKLWTKLLKKLIY